MPRPDDRRLLAHVLLLAVLWALSLYALSTRPPL